MANEKRETGNAKVVNKSTKEPTSDRVAEATEENLSERVVNEHQQSSLTWSEKLHNICQKVPFLHSSNGEMRKRVISALILIPIAIIAIYVSFTVFAILTIALTILMSAEWTKITLSDTQNAKRWALGGFFYIFVPITAALILRKMPNGVYIILWMLFIVWATDTAAMFVGKTLDGPKLAPTLSPHKTWSGLIGGVLAAMLIGFLSSFIFQPGNLNFFILVSGMLAVIEQLSDLLESKVKRYFNLKDSGDLIPGHGGILDRLDGITLVAPIVLLIVLTNTDKFF